MRRALRIAGIVVVVLLLAAAALAAVAYWQARSIVDELQAGPKRAEVEQARPELERPPRRPAFAAPTTGAQTFLLIGSDRRRTGQEGARSDTVLLLRLDAERHRVALLSIPRDLFVEIPGRGGDRINEAFHRGGARLLIRTVRETFGVKIDHFVEVNYAGFRDLVAAVGGVYLPVDQRYFNVNRGTADTNYASIDLEPGYQRLDGEDALAFARYRHGDSDLYRAARQQLFLREVVRQVLAERRDVLGVRRLARAFARATTSDIDSLREIWWIYRTVHGTPASRYVRLTLPTSDLVLFGADYLAASAVQRRSAVRRWYGIAPRPRRRAPAAPRARAPLAPAQLAGDGGAGARLLRRQAPIRRCAPSSLPPGYAWPAGAARSYELDGHPAIALYATAGSGRSVLWTMTTWDDPPVLGPPSRTLHRRGRAYDVWSEGGRIHQIAWRLGPTQVWITNTLRDELTSPQMLALALSCRPLGGG